MPVFTYTALKSGKDLINGKIEAKSLRDAREALRDLNLIPTKINEEKAKAAKKSSTAKKEKIILKKLSTREKIDFTNSLYVLSKTGISLVEALLFIEMNATSAKVQALVIELRKMLLSGANFSEAIFKMPQIFDQVYAGIIRAGEETGELDTTLERLVFLLNKQDKLKSRVISTLIYPCFIIILSLLVSLVMIIFVFPAFESTYANSGHKLPFITQMFMDVGKFLKAYWYTLPIMFGSAFGSLYFLFNWPTSRKLIDKHVLDIPVLSTFIKYAYLSNFVSILRVSFDAGIPVIDGILLANKTVVNYELKKALRESASKIQNGQSLSTGLKLTGFIPPIVMCMISTGEESGQLGETLYQSELYIDTQLEQLIELLNKLFEPVLLLVIGAIVLSRALALSLPLFQGYSNMM